MNLVNWGVWSKRCGPFLWKGTSCGAKLCVPLCDLCASVWATSVWGRRPVWGCVVWGGGRTRWSPHDSQLAWGVPPLTMPHKGDLKLPPVTQGDVTTNKINATRTDSNKCHLNGVSNNSVWVFTICPKRGLFSVQMRQPQDSSFEIYVNYHRRYDGEIQGF